MKKAHFKYILASSLLLVPAVTFAATSSTFKELIYTIISYLNMVLVLLMAVAVVAFTYYVVKYYVLPNENRTEGNTYVMYSIIGFFVILSFWGLVNIVQNSFGLGNLGNRPSSWASFTNIFPGGNSSSNDAPSGTYLNLNGTQSTNDPAGVFGN